MVMLNELLDQVEPSKSVTLLAKTRALQKENPNILNFTGGEPDFDTPEAIVEEAYRQLRLGETHYADAKGDAGLRAEIAKKLAEENNAPYAADNVLVTPGAKLAIFLTCMALINKGDEVIWLTPGWVSYPAIVTLCGGTPVAVNLDYENDYKLTEAKLEEKTTDKTKLLIINYPNNPTGKILSSAELDELKSYLRKHPQVLVISDEIYEKVIYDGNQCISIAGDPEFFNRVVIINGFSKCVAMTGWRLGYLACCDEIYKGIMKVFQHSMSCTSTFIQKAAIKAFYVPDDVERMRSAYECRRNILLEGLNALPGVEFKVPQGAFYAWVKFDTKLTPAELCDRLLTEAGIAGIPGDAYGEEQGCLVRFCFAAEDEKLHEMLRRMKDFCKKL